MAYFYKTIMRTKKYRYLQILKCASSIECVTNNPLVLFSNRNSLVRNHSINILKNNMRFLHATMAYSTKLEDEDYQEPGILENEGMNMVELINKKYVSRESLYPDSEDPIIINLKNCTTIQEVTDIIYKEKSKLNHTHLCQALLTLSSLQTAYQESYLDNLGKYDIDTSPERMLESYMNQQSSHKGFKDFIQLFNNFHENFNISELVSCTFHFKKIGLCYGDAEFMLLLNSVVDKLVDDPFHCDLKTLIKYTASIKSDSSHLFGNNAKYAIPALVAYLENCKTEEDFKDITLCLNNIHLLVSPSLLELYKCQCMKLVNSGCITAENYKTITTILRFLSLSHWSKSCMEECNALCLLAEPSIDKMDISDITVLHKVFRIHLEPATMICKLQKRIQFLLEEVKYDDRIKTYLKLPDLLFCEIYNSWVNNRILFKGIISDLLKKSFPSTLSSLYNCLRFLKVTDESDCDLFWEKMVNESLLISNNENQLLELCLKYMYFNNNLGGTYRNMRFEEMAISNLLKMKKDGLADVIPWKFVRVLSFFIAYGFSSSEKVWQHNNLAEMVEKLNNTNLSVGDIFVLSRGLNIFSKIKGKKNILENSEKKSIEILNKILNEDSNKIIHNNLNLSDLNIICNSFINRSSAFDCDLFDSILYKYNSLKAYELSSSFIKQAVYNFTSTNTLAPNFVDQTVDYIISKDINIFGDVILKFIFYIYYAGYTPGSIKIFDVTNKILYRDKEILGGLSLLHGCQALSFYGHLSEKLINYIFSLEFMEQLDREIGNCYSRKSYPKRLRENLMSLNRTVCLEYPELAIPWFHQKYIEEVHSFAPVYKTNFSEDVLHHLYALLEDRNLVSYLHHTPYGYTVDFCIKMCKNKQTTSMDDAEKVAILLLKNHSFVKVYNDERPIELVKIGPAQLKRRHLELLGYRVIEIPHAFWNSMHMSEPDAKLNFLKDNILR